FDIVPNDPEFINQWHLAKIDDHDIDAPEGWDSETGSSDIVIAILDSGIRYFHKDLGGLNASYSNPTGTRGNMWINWTEKNGLSGIDDDSNGFIDDWIGWDFYSDDNDPRDSDGHGTHVAGIIAAGTNDGYGSCGIAGGWDNGSMSVEGNGVKIMALRVGDFQVNMAMAAQALYYAANNGAKIVNCSWPSDNSGNLDDAIAYFLANDGIVFKSAGNTNSQVPDYINGLEYPTVISVAATDSLDKKADFSNYGTWIDISAPGTNIISTYHINHVPENDYWSAKSGTSMASPIAAATAASVWSHWPQWNAEQVTSWMLELCVDNIRPYLDLQHSVKMGSGRVNISKVICPNDISDEWDQVYATDISDNGVDIRQISDGGYITLINGMDSVSNDHNIYLQKTDTYGCMEWSKSIKYSSANELIANRFVPTSAGGYLIVGDLETVSNATDVCLIMVDSLGENLWERTYGGLYNQKGHDVYEMSDGNFLITGTCEYPSEDGNVLIMKIDDQTGDSLQSAQYGQYGISDREDGQRIFDCFSGGYIVMASTNAGEAYFLWLDNNLDSTKTVIYNQSGKTIVLNSMESLSDEGYICAGSIKSVPPDRIDKDVFILKLDLDGNECWSKTFGYQTYNEIGSGIKVTTDGGLIIASETDAAGLTARDIVLYKTNACGNLHWEETLYELGDEYPQEIIQTSDGGFAFCGGRTASIETNSHSYIVKIPEQPSYRCGDVNDDETFDVLDIVFLINYKHKGGPATVPENRGDVNCDDTINNLDYIYLIDFKYKGGSAPCPCN
ncbi:MAG: S8 family serine peptidase, partial [candidate division Zixibacteria bacterium]|nr:S8 family serine peptidase [candidate division Zixibacteria bacterium]